MIKAYVIRHTDDNIEHRESFYMYDTLKEAYEHARKRADLFIERWHWNGVGFGQYPFSLIVERPIHLHRI